MGQLRECCCCISLETGAAIIGLLYLIGSTASVSGLTLALIQLFSPHDFAMSRPGAEFYDPEFDPELEVAYKAICIVLIVLCCMQFIVDVLLMVAGVERKSSLAVPWLVVNMVVLILFSACMIALSIFGFLFRQPFINFVSIAPLVVGFVYLAVTTFAMMFVSAFYETAKYQQVKKCISSSNDYVRYTT